MELWRPKWWRLPVFETAGKSQRNPATGKRKRKSSDGKRLRNTASKTACCCAAPANCCALFPTFAFSGIQVFGPTGCWYSAAYGGYWSSTFPGSTTVTGQGNDEVGNCPSCVWSNTPLYPWNIYLSSNSSCTTHIANTGLTGPQLVAAYSGGNMYVRLWLAQSYGTDSGGSNGSGKVFEATFAWDCATPTTASSILTTLNVTSAGATTAPICAANVWNENTVFGTGGTVTVSA
jgi:hypothetical protein